MLQAANININLQRIKISLPYVLYCSFIQHILTSKMNNKKDLNVARFLALMGLLFLAMAAIVIVSLLILD